MMSQDSDDVCFSHVMVVMLMVLTTVSSVLRDTP